MPAMEEVDFWPAEHVSTKVRDVFLTDSDLLPFTENVNCGF